MNKSDEIDECAAGLGMDVPLTKPARPINPIAIPPGYEQEVIELARRTLDDIPECRGAEYFVKWTRDLLPILVIAFVQYTTLDGGTPALGVCLISVRKGTFNNVLPGKDLLSGDRLRDKILRSSFDYLNVNGIQITLGVN